MYLTAHARAYILIAIAIFVVGVTYIASAPIVTRLKPALATSTVGTPIEHPGRTPFEHAAPHGPSAFLYTFNVDGELEETASIAHSPSPYWHVDSGGRMVISHGVGQTMHGLASEDDRWRAAYNASNPTDTDGGRYPQNIFRLVSKETWRDSRIEASFRIVKDNLTDSPSRNESNGILFMSRYKEGGETLYYAGLRVDGNAVIKKKFDGVYYTLALKKLYRGTYDRTKDPDLLPHGEWIRLRMETVEEDAGVRIRLYKETEGVWELLVESLDDGSHGNTPPITTRDHIGIRTDYMDVEFREFRAQPL